MADTCYSRGKKIILTPGHNRNGRWFCRFTIPGLLDSGLCMSHKQPLETYKTEWEAKKAAFQSAKKMLDAAM